MARTLLAVCVCCVSLAAASASRDNLTREQQEQYRSLASEFVAPCCWREALTSHRSPKAAGAREELLAMVQAGRDDREIREAFAKTYGAAILMIPEGERARWLFATPFVAALAAIGLAGCFLASLRKRRDPPGSKDGTPVIEVDEAELEW